MPSELRHILFRPAEVIEALRKHQARMSQPIPAGQVVECAPEPTRPGEPLRFRVGIVAETGRPSFAAGPKALRQDFVFDAPTIAAALIQYCHDHRIPLSANAEKSLQRFGEQIGLVTTYNMRQAPAPTAEPLRA
jgi:hypothetical protein